MQDSSASIVQKRVSLEMKMLCGSHKNPTRKYRVFLWIKIWGEFYTVPFDFTPLDLF